MNSTDIQTEDGEPFVSPFSPGWRASKWRLAAKVFLKNALVLGFLEQG
jgi:hypothetical protein